MTSSFLNFEPRNDRRRGKSIKDDRVDFCPTKWFVPIRSKRRRITSGRVGHFSLGRMGDFYAILYFFWLVVIFRGKAGVDARVYVVFGGRSNFLFLISVNEGKG